MISPADLEKHHSPSEAELEKHYSLSDWGLTERSSKTEAWQLEPDDYSQKLVSYTAEDDAKAPTKGQSSEPPNMNRHLVALAESHKMLDFPHDWDGEGSPGYKDETWTRVRTFLEEGVLGLWRTYGLVIDSPRIRPGPDGSIDVRWKGESRRLLVNFPEDTSVPATYYGKSDTGDIGGSFDPEEKALWLMTWLAG